MLDEWEKGLSTLGGALVPKKSHWTLVGFQWKHDHWKYLMSDDTPGNILMRDPISQELKNIKKLQPSDAHKTLGIFLAGDSNNKEQIKSLRAKLQKYTQCLKSRIISKLNTVHALWSTVMKTLEYPLLACNIDEHTWKSIVAPAI